jgi:hypothetical protein
MANLILSSFQERNKILAVDGHVLVMVLIEKQAIRDCTRKKITGAYLCGSMLNISCLLDVLVRVATASNSPNNYKTETTLPLITNEFRKNSNFCLTYYSLNQ